MTAFSSNQGDTRTVFLTVLLLAVIASGIPRTEMHSHSDAQFGHVHDYYNHHEPDNEQPGDAENIGDPSLMHVHDVGIQSLTIAPSLNAVPVQLAYVCSGVPPPATRPPDNQITPLYRPPIA